ncbi:protein serine/threonine phosphatase 2C [Aspergillus sclerotiicarbonarius CBS 121057]|uniref:Protein serine/threonine phosphatase 2C n=1 Tax=Aspergillus sclerotiicarbonarius (strain CBS 121057 / IBT 28362) TaxID=1448318 RepID=A0A319DWI3_ASPSB|nr:protein serine/threonine phosphatase 2C [Aspergillus sclerotiicarbonarius CBS 121057]
MLPFSVARSRLRLTAAPILRKSARNRYSTMGPASSRLRNIAVVCVITTPGICYGVAIQDDAPYLHSPPADHWDIEPGPSKEQVTSILSQAAYSFPVKNVPGVVRYDGAQLASTNPCEDQFIHGKVPSPWNDDNQWMAWGVFDGHIGVQTAALLKEKLLPFVRYSLDQSKSYSGEEMVPDELVQRAIMKGFMNLDDSIIKEAHYTSQSEESLPEKVKKLTPAFSGSCALLSMYDPIASTLHVACTGDSRAVLGYKSRDGQWVAIPLSVDQTGYNESEVARICAEHPGEENIIEYGRVLGLGVSRAFGDCEWKWPLDFQTEMQQRFYGPGSIRAIPTPPYVTAEPVVTSTKIDPGSPSFLIIATDGLWGLLSNEQAVNLVGKWLELRASEQRTDPEPTYEPFDFGPFWKDMNWKFVEERTTVQDDNAAVHLLRNSLGGNHHEMIAGRLAFTYPSSRRVRDDMTVQVVFFYNDALMSKDQPK